MVPWLICKVWRPVVAFPIPRWGVYPSFRSRRSVFQTCSITAREHCEYRMNNGINPTRGPYTLYEGTEHPFVHALDTIHRDACCIDLDWLHGRKGFVAAPVRRQRRRA